LKEKSIVLEEKILVHEEKPILVQDESKPILGFDKVQESFAMDESSLNATIQMDSMLVPSFEETIWRFKFKKKKSLPRFKKWARKKMRSF